MRGSVQPLQDLHLQQMVRRGTIVNFYLSWIFFNFCCREGAWHLPCLQRFNDLCRHLLTLKLTNDNG